MSSGVSQRIFKVKQAWFEIFLDHWIGLEQTKIFNFLVWGGISFIVISNILFILLEGKLFFSLIFSSILFSFVLAFFKKILFTLYKNSFKVSDDSFVVSLYVDSFGNLVSVKKYDENGVLRDSFFDASVATIQLRFISDVLSGEKYLILVNGHRSLSLNINKLPIEIDFAVGNGNGSSNSFSIYGFK